MNVTDGQTLAPPLRIPAKNVIEYQPRQEGVKSAHVFTHEDTHSSLQHGPEQKALIHGVDLKKIVHHQGDEGSTRDYTVSGPATNAQGKRVIVKGAIPAGDIEAFGSDKKSHSKVTTAMRETLYHNLAHAMGMGKFVPKTATINDEYEKHKEQGPWGNHYSVMEMIPNAEHYNYEDPKHNDVLAKAQRAGDIHKLAILNTLLGNTDRHTGNFMISPKGLHMIDHGLTFGWHPGNKRDIFEPRYVQDSDIEQGSNRNLHPKAKEWIKALDPKVIQKVFKDNKVGVTFSKPMLSALQKTKELIESAEKHNVPISLKTVREMIYDHYQDYQRGEQD
jgi:hypothetical protein